MKYQIFLTRTIFILYLMNCLSAFAQDQKHDVLNIENILILNIDTPITSVTSDYVDYQIKHHKHDLIIIKMNTPGGLLSSTKNIVQSLLNNKKPIITWIGPDGSSASSAGAIIASASHKIYMSQASNIGAATPVSMFGDFEAQSDMRKKILEDTTAYIRSLCDLNHRDPLHFEEMVSKAKSFSASEALHNGIIDGISQNIDDLFMNIDGLKVQIHEKEYEINLSENKRSIETQFDFGQNVLSILSEPNIIFALLLLGIVLIYIELQAPGGFIAGGIGAISLILSSVGMQIIPINYAALLLFVLSGILFYIEIYVTSFGLLFIGGTISSILGALFLFRTEDSLISVSTGVLFSILFMAIIIGVFLVYFIMKNRKYIGKDTFNELTGATGHIISTENDGAYMAKIGPEMWKCYSKSTLKTGDKIIVICKNNDLSLQVKINP